jgi:hypothetical protein
LRGLDRIDSCPRASARPHSTCKDSFGLPRSLVRTAPRRCKLKISQDRHDLAPLAVAVVHEALPA